MYVPDFVRMCKFIRKNLRKNSGHADTMQITHMAKIIPIDLFNPLNFWKEKGWQIAKYRSIENASTVKTDVL